MFLCRLQKVFICTERNCLSRAVQFRNGLKNVKQYVRFVSNVHYPQNIVTNSFATDFASIEKFWKQNQDNGITDFLFQCFEKENDCFSYAVYLMSQAYQSGFQNSVDLVVTTLHALALWKESSGTSQEPSAQLQSEALMTALSSKNRFLAQLVCDVFSINGQCDFIDDIIETCLSRRKYMEAATCILVLKIQGKYPVEKILLPIIKEGKTNLAILYIGENKDLLMKMIKSLDDYLLAERHSASKLKHLCKRLSSLLTAYGIPQETCPNLLEIRGRSALNFIMYKRYSEKSITPLSWEEMTMALLRDSPNLHKKLIRKLVAVGDFNTAVKMASKLNIPAHELPPDLKNSEANEEDFPHNSEDMLHVEKGEICRPDSSSDPQDPNCVENGSEVEYLSLQLDKSCLKYVETVEQFEDCLNTISKNAVVGFDSEWRPSSRGLNSRLALMQLAVEDEVYLLDFVALSACLKNSHWDDLTVNLFGNPKILKLGCGLTSDVAILVKSYQGTVGVPVKFSRLLDVGIFFQKFQAACPDIFPNEEGRPLNIYNTLGLSKICAYVLGSPLKKERQFSDWEMRPLDDSQLHYAALDAYCLLQIYDKLMEVAEEWNLDFESMLQESVKLSEGTFKSCYEPRGRMKWSKSHEGFEFRPVVFVKEFKVLMDPSLESLGKGLKNYGVDVTFLENSTAYSDAIELAKAEKRIILAGSLLYKQLKGLTSERICYEIGEPFANDQSSVAYVFQKFNIRFQAGDINYKDDVCSTS